MISLSLPYPPSSNRLWRSVRGRNIKSAEYRKWEAACWDHIVLNLLQSKRAPDGPYAITYTVPRPDRRRRDLENLTKALGDMLQVLGVIRDDCDCERSTIAWAPGPPVKNPLVLVEITPA